MKINYGTASIVSISLALPLALMIGNITSLLLKNSNPDNVDIAADLAYLSQSVTAAVITFFTLAIVSLITAFLGMKKSNKEYAKLSFIILLLVVLISASAALVQKRIEHVEAEYSRQQINSNLYNIFKDN